MLLSFGIIIILGLVLSQLLEKFKLPGLIGFLLIGFLLGPGMLNAIDSSLLAISSDLRSIALIIILSRAGLSLNISELKKVGRPAILMSFLPAMLEILAMVFLAPILFSVSITQAVIMGTVVAAVSPAVIIPKMLKIMQEGYGTKKSIPQMILASATIDDVFVIVLFTIFVEVGKGANLNVYEILTLPISIVLGCVLGIIIGSGLFKLFASFNIRNSLKVLIILALGLILYPLENLFEAVPFSALICIMAIGMTLKQRSSDIADKLSSKLAKIWIFAELMLFVLVGATVDPSYLVGSFFKVLLLLIVVLSFRVAGVLLCLIRTSLNRKERLFCVIGYLPKATVQAAIGSIPLAMGINGGELILAVAVMAILITAPVGALLIDLFYKKLLVDTKL